MEMEGRRRSRDGETSWGGKGEMEQRIVRKPSPLQVVLVTTSGAHAGHYHTGQAAGIFIVDLCVIVLGWGGSTTLHLPHPSPHAS